MKKKKLNLDELKVISFVTSINHRNKGTIRGMFGLGLTALECDAGEEQDDLATNRRQTHFLCTTITAQIDSCLPDAILPDPN